MRMKNFFKTAIFAGTLAVGCAAAINFAPNVEAATYDYSKRSITSKGKSDYGVYNGKVINIKDYYKQYVSSNSVYSWRSNEKTSWKSSTTDYSKNTYFNNYKVSGVGPFDSQINVYSDDPIVAFVDRTCFEKAGDYFLMGDEYGYYVHTESQDQYSLRSLVLLFDITYGWDYNQYSDSTMQSVKIEVVSQTSVCALNYKELKKNIGNHYAVDAVSESDYFSKTRQIYQFDSNLSTWDNYVICPVLKAGWQGQSDGHSYWGLSGVLAQYDYLYLTDICYTAKYHLANGTNSYFSLAKIDYNNARSFKFETDVNWKDKVSHAVEDFGQPILSFLDGKCADTFGDKVPLVNAIYTVVDSVKDIAEAREKSFMELYPSYYDETPINSAPSVENNYIFTYNANLAVDSNFNTNDNSKYLIIGQNEGNPASVTYKTYFSGYNPCYTDSCLLALPVIKRYKRMGESISKNIIRPENVTYMNNVYGQKAISSNRYMDFSTECFEMNSTYSFGTITTKAGSSTMNFDIPGTTPYVIEFYVPESGNYSLSVWAKTQADCRVVIWNRTNKKAVFINDYTGTANTAVYLDSGYYLMEVSPRIYTLDEDKFKKASFGSQKINFHTFKIGSKSSC